MSAGNFHTTWTKLSCQTLVHVPIKFFPFCSSAKKIGKSSYRVFRSRMSFSRWLKMTEKRNLHNKSRLLYYQNSPPFHFIAIYFLKICHKSSKFQEKLKNWLKNLSIFFSSKLIFWWKPFILKQYEHILRWKKKSKNFMLW